MLALDSVLMGTEPEPEGTSAEYSSECNARSPSGELGHELHEGPGRSARESSEYRRESSEHRSPWSNIVWGDSATAADQVGP